MEPQPVRRRRRRRRSSTAGRESLAWLTWFINLGRRAYHWAALVIILLVILTLGLGAPLVPLESILAFWPTW